MAVDPRRFDQIERVVRDTRQSLEDLASTLLARIASHTHSAYALAANDLWAWCTADTTRNNSTTLLDITGMAVSLAASSVYAIRSWAYYESTPVADIQFGWTLPSGAAGQFSGIAPDFFQAPIAGAERVNYTDFTTEALTITKRSAGDDTSTGSIFICAQPTGYIETTNAGTLQMRFAQNTAEATNTRVKRGSWMHVRKLA